MRILGPHCWETVTTFACRLVPTAAWVAGLQTDTYPLSIVVAYLVSMIRPRKCAIALHEREALARLMLVATDQNIFGNTIYGHHQT